MRTAAFKKTVNPKVVKARNTRIENANKKCREIEKMLQGEPSTPISVHDFLWKHSEGKWERKGNSQSYTFDIAGIPISQDTFVRDVRDFALWIGYEPKVRIEGTDERPFEVALYPEDMLICVAAVKENR